MSRTWWQRWLGLGSANRSQRRNRHHTDYRPQISRLEERDVPSAYVPTDNDYKWMAAQTEYLLGQQSSPTPFTYAHQWVVGMTATGNAGLLAGQLGVVSSEATPLIARTHLWDFAANENYQATAATLAAAQQDGRVAFYYPSLSYAYSQFFTPNDPRYSEQWHLKNTGQQGGVAGEDIKAETGWDVARGNGQLIVVTDSGTQIDHPDLIGSRWTNPEEIAGNSIDDDANGFVDDLYGWNFGNDTNNPSSGDHGTAVTGISAAKGNNAVGVAGVAFDARWAAFKAIGTAGATDANLGKALAYKNKFAAAYNNSWGINAINDLASFGPLVKAAIVDSINNGRNGLGSVMVFAAGNSGDIGERTNYHEPENMPYVINVSALENTGILADYSTFGASVFVSAPSASVTTDETGNAGYGSGDYTTGFNGTSAAAPVVAGVVADILSVNPALRGRDVMHIMAKTSTKVDPSDPSWQTNGAGYHTSHKYGLGRPNLGAALALARNWVSVGPAIQSETATVAPNQAIPDNNNTGVTSSVTINNNFEAEFVVVRTRITHAARGDLELELISPSGTKSLLAEVHDDTNPDYNWQFASTQFWGERVAGQWRLVVRDKKAGSIGTVDNWELEITGVKSQPPVVGGGTLEILPSPVNEGRTTVVRGRFTDPDGAGEIHYVDVNWGDGGPTERVKLFIGQSSFAIPHVFRDNGVFRVSVSIADQSGSASGSEFGSAIVHNVAPTAVIQGTPATAPEGKAINLFGSATDPGILDTFTYSWNVTKNGVAYATGNSAAFSFTPDDQGIYRINLRVNDDDGGIGNALQTRVVVTNTAPTGNLTNDGPKPLNTNLAFTLNANDGGVDLASMKYSFDFDNDNDFTSPGDILNGAANVVNFQWATPGIRVVRARATDKDGAFTDFFTDAATGMPGVYNPTTRYYAVGAGFGAQPTVRTFELNNTEKFNFLAYAAGFQGGVRVATGDVTGDGVEEIITAPGAGGGPHVKVFNGVNGALIREFMAPTAPGYTGGLTLAAGDLNSDTKADIIIGTGAGRIVVIDGASVFPAANPIALLGTMNFQPFVGFTGLVNVGAGDVNGDRIMDLVAGTGAGVAPQVRVFSFDFAGGGGPLLTRTITPFEATMRGGVTVSVGDVNGDRRGDIVVGTGGQPGYLSRVKVFNGANLSATLWNFAPFPGYSGGIQVTTEDLDGDGKADMIVSPNTGTPGRILALKGTNLKKLAYFMPFDAAFLGGVHVG